MDELERWLAEDYDLAYRTAWLITGNPAAAQEATHEAFLRVWRLRHAVPTGAPRRGWLYRVLVARSRYWIRGNAPGRGDADVGPPADSSSVAQAIAAAVRELPIPLRVVAALRYCAGLTDHELAVAVRHRPGVVRSQCAAAQLALSIDARLAEWAVAEEVPS